MLDYAAPEIFPPREQPPGVGPHPHRGFETVTIVYAGEIEHRDSAGHSGKIGVGDVQWMTAASGILHDEFHSREQSRKGGPVSMVQLWVNLPAKYKMTKPSYQTLLAQDIPVIALSDEAGQLRVIAGAFNDQQGPARTFSPLSVWDVKLEVGKQAHLPIPKGYRTLLALLEGEISIGEKAYRKGQVLFFSDQGEHIEISAKKQTKFLILSGEPINEPIAHYGPFVMNTQDEIRTAIDDFRRGRMGHLAA
jgi:redox-sensitive bicupin YhaK (pirin superfamily)